MEFTDVNELIVVDEDVDVYVEMDTGSEVLVSYPKGSMVLLSGKSKDWYRVIYRGQEGYLKTDSTVVNVNLNVTELDDEFAADAKNENYLIENIQTQQAYRRSNFIWTGIIVILFLAIIGVTIFERKKKRGEEKIDDAKDTIREWNDNIEFIDSSELPDREGAEEEGEESGENQDNEENNVPE